MRVLKMRDFISWSHESIPKIPSSHRVFLGKRDPNSQMKRKAGIRIAAIISIQQASSQGEITVTESPFIRRHLDAQSHLFLNCQSLSRCSLSLSFLFSLHVRWRFIMQARRNILSTHMDDLNAENSCFWKLF
jgi:hypothetical protein